MSMMMSRAAMRRTAVTNTNPGLRGGQQEPNGRPKPVAVLDVDALDDAEDAGKRAKTFKWELTCGIKNGVVSFFAQLKGKKSVFLVPVMPKDEYGNPLTPINVVNGARGYLTVAVSNNAQFEESEKGQYTMPIRPEFWSFDETLEEAQKAGAELEAKLAGTSADAE